MRRWPFRRREPTVDLYDEESLQATEHGILIARIAELEERLAWLEELAGLFPPAHQYALFPVPGGAR